jgi:hypothetical protein
MDKMPLYGGSAVDKSHCSIDMIIGNILTLDTIQPNKVCHAQVKTKVGLSVSSLASSLNFDCW